jgi:hypothetical protein
MSFLAGLLPGLTGGLFGMLGGASKEKQMAKQLAQEFQYQMQLQNAQLANQMDIAQMDTGEKAREFDTTNANRGQELGRRNKMQSIAAPSMLYALGYRDWNDEIAPMTKQMAEAPESQLQVRSPYYGLGASDGGSDILKKYLGGDISASGIKSVDQLTGPGGIQKAFEQALSEIDTKHNGDWNMKRQAYDQLVQLGSQFASKGGDYQKAAMGMFDTISPLFGQTNPLRLKTTSKVM